MINFKDAIQNHIKHFARNLENKKILDIGCGTRKYTYFLVREIK